MALIATALITLAIFVASRSLLGHRSTVTADRLASIAGPRVIDETLGVGDRVLRPIIEAIASFSSMLLPARIGTHIEGQLTAAGQPISVGTFFTILTGLPLAFGGLAALALWTTEARLLAPMIAALAAVAPFVWLSGRATRRRARIALELPDILDLIVVSVEAGLGLEAAIARITDQVDGVLADELRRVLGELNLGVGRRRALQALVARTSVPSVASLVSAILQAEQTGMGIAQVLRAQSDHLRTLRRQHAEEAAMKAPLKMLFPLVFCIFPSLFVVLLGPAVLQLLKAMGGTR